ncbi:MAG: hypothetical protein NW201_09485 [Gemmatimonadales bacterium]|nr:hypothetical protein [Gemmatimonadales bacterium]
MTGAPAPGAVGALLGHVHAQERDPATAHAFRFRAEPGAACGIGDVVRVDAPGRVILGLIVDAAAWDDGGTAPERRLFSVQVLRQLPPEPIAPVPLAAVRAATAADIPVALRQDAFDRPGASTAIPLGVLVSGGVATPVALDADFLVGPEAAHVNLSGISGLATKTSAALLLLQSLFQHFPAAKGRVAAVCFNLKGADLLFLDQAAALGADDLARHAAMGLRAEPFPRVRYWAPPGPDGVTPATLRTHPALAESVEPLAWGLREVLDFAEVVLERDDLDAKADAFLDFLADRVVGREFLAPELRPEPFTVRSFADLELLFRAIFDSLEGGRGEQWRTHHVATIRKVRNRLGNISVRSRGLVTDDGVTSDLPWGAFEDRTVYVIDAARMDPLAQDLVFARTVAQLRERLERRDLGVDFVLVFVDELNKVAPADGQDTPIRRMLLDIAERGRYLGLVLVSAQQFRSQVLRRVTGNSATAVYGRMDPDELASPLYQTLTPALRARLATLGKGELMVRQPHCPQPVFVRIPRPAVLMGHDGLERFPPAAEPPFAEAVARRLARLDRQVDVAGLAARLEGRREEDVRRALARTLAARPHDATAYFLTALGQRVEGAAPPRRTVPALARGDDDYGAL